MDPTNDPAPVGGIPPITPDFNAPGVSGLTSLAGTISAWALVLAGIAIILGGLIAVAGPRFGFHGAKSVGMGGIIGGLALGGIVALATPGVDTVRSWFG